MIDKSNRIGKEQPSGDGAMSERGIWIAAAAVLLGILHQDFWFWDDATLVFGFLPVGLFYHAMFSIVAGVLWAAAVKWAWPSHLEEWADEFEPSGTKAAGTEQQGGKK